MAYPWDQNNPFRLADGEQDQQRLHRFLEEQKRHRQVYEVQAQAIMGMGLHQQEAMAKCAQPQRAQPAWNPNNLLLLISPLT